MSDSKALRVDRHLVDSGRGRTVAGSVVDRRDADDDDITFLGRCALAGIILAALTLVVWGLSL